MSNKRIGLIVLGIVIFIFLFAGAPFYVVKEFEQTIITQFGKPIGESKQEAGLYFKIPFIQKVTYFDKRILEWDGDPDQLPTKEKRNIWVDITARWRIKDPLKFFQSVYDERNAHSRLDDIIDAAVRDLVSSNKLIELVRFSNKMLSEKELKKDDMIQEFALEKISKGRETIRAEIFERAKRLVPQYGIELIDVRIKRVSYVEEVRKKVYERMISERKRAAERHRSEGRGEKAKVEGRTEKELKQILSLAYKKSQKVKGQADKLAIEIYASAYGEDLDFFSFLKTLEAYSESVDRNSMLILTTDSDYFKYLKKIFPE
ncbi:MAG: protease modulator HflC [Candidatus Omnitrophica bacterium]|nr:protease modulator HflC [Candidatus Omnitrophota bacterium]